MGERHVIDDFLRGASRHEAPRIWLKTTDSINLKADPCVTSSFWAKIHCASAVCPHKEQMVRIRRHAPDSARWSEAEALRD
jgi:hypothetical protein